MKTKYNTRVLMVLAAGLPLIAFGEPAETAAERLERGVFLQENEKDLDAAIREFEGVLRNEAKAASHGAEARFRLIQCYLEKENEKAAAEQLEKLKSSYPPENRWVKQAIELLESPLVLGPAPWKSGEVLTYDIAGPGGQSLGRMLSAIAMEDLNGAPVWVSYFIRAAEVTSLSRARFDTGSFLPIEARSFVESFGDSTLEFPSSGGVVARDSVSGKELWKSDGKALAGAPRPLFDNDQTVQILRLIPQEIGTKHAIHVVMGLNAAPIPFDMEVTAHEEITTPAGTFPCAKIETNLNQTFWISTDEHRHLVRIGLGVVNVDLISIATRDPAKGEVVRSEHFGAKIALAGNWLRLPPVDNDEVFRMNILSTDFAPLRAMLEINRTKNLVEAARESSRAFADTFLANRTGRTDEFTLDEDSWQEGSVAGIDTVSVMTREKRGQLEIRILHVFGVGEEKSVHLSLFFNDGDQEPVEKKAAALLGGITFD